MIGRFRWNLQLVLRKVWVRALAYGLLGIVTALAAVAVRPFLPADLGARIGADAVDQILGIIASSMLAVTTFSLSVMVTAFGGVTTTATPRAIELLKQDATTQKVLATFIGAFLFALVGIVALKTGVYGDRGRLVLFVATIAVLSAVVLALLRWIAHLMDFGRLSDTLGRVEAAATAALRSRMAMPYLGGHPLRGAPPVTSTPLPAHTTGYVQHIDMAQLSALADIAGREMYLAALPGTFVHPAAPLLHVAGLDDDLADKARSAFSIGEGRTYDQDPRFGVIALTEAASRALSPAVNDPGTAIEVIGRLVRVLSEWTDPAEAEVVWPRLHVPPIRSDDLIEDAFRPIARDGASLIEVQIRLQKALLALAEMAPQVFAPQTARASADALARAAAAGLLPDEIAALRALSDRVAALTEGQPRRATLQRLDLSQGAASIRGAACMHGNGPTTGERPRGPSNGHGTMIGLVEAQRAWWMAHGMARISGVHLARAVVDGWMTRSELARMVSRCEDCGRVCDCQQWLADPTHSAPPAFCGIGAEISALAGDRP